MKIEAVITCAKYSDFLAHTLPYNRTLFDRLIVVAPPEDKETQRVCEYWHVECRQSDRMRAHWGEFRKGCGINDGLARLDKDGWLVHLDADIVLPPLFRHVFGGLDLDPAYIYGVDRFMVPNFTEWSRFIGAPKLCQENETWIHLNAFEIGVRVMHGHQYVPIGFTQIWHGSSGRLSYPEEHTSAARGDMAFAEQWPRNRRGFIPEIVAYHLESEKADMGANWNGRATKMFGQVGEGYEK